MPTVQFDLNPPYIITTQNSVKKARLLRVVDAHLYVHSTYCIKWVDCIKDTCTILHSMGGNSTMIAHIGSMECSLDSKLAIFGVVSFTSRICTRKFVSEDGS